jgi:hypothetical protein
VFVTVNFNVCKSAIALCFMYLNTRMIKRDCNQSTNKSNHPY